MPDVNNIARSAVAARKPGKPGKVVRVMVEVMSEDPKDDETLLGTIYIKMDQDHGLAASYVVEAIDKVRGVTSKAKIERHRIGDGWQTLVSRALDVVGGMWRA